jgi:uncharacterized membrane protein
MYVAVLALLGAAIATYLASIQLRQISLIWDPVFGSGSTEAVLRSAFSRALPVPDAAVGALAYLLEAVLALSGRFVVAFAAVVLALAIAGIGLVIVQIVVVHAFCTLCLCSAAISWANLLLSHEDIAAAASTIQRRMQ